MMTLCPSARLEQSFNLGYSWRRKKSLFIRRLCRCRRATILCTDYLIRPDPKPKKRECNTKKKLSFLVKLLQKYDVLCPCVCWCVCTPLGGVFVHLKSFGFPFAFVSTFPKFLVDIPPLSEWKHELYLIPKFIWANCHGKIPLFLVVADDIFHEENQKKKKQTLFHIYYFVVLGHFRSLLPVCFYAEHSYFRDS